MNICRAEEKHIPGMIELLKQVGQVHHQGRPDLFRAGAQKYNEADLQELLQDENRPIFIAQEDEKVLGYCFCILKVTRNNPVLADNMTLYIDDLCVDETNRGKHIGKSLYEHVLAEAKKMGCYHVTLNVWCLNESAMRFYEKCGLSPLKITMEKIL